MQLIQLLINTNKARGARIYERFPAQLTTVKLCFTTISGNFGVKTEF